MTDHPEKPKFPPNRDERDVVSDGYALLAVALPFLVALIVGALTL